MFASYIIPTFNRAAQLSQTLEAIGTLDRYAHESAGGAEVIVVDNHSSPPIVTPAQLANGIPVRVLPRPANEGAAARNHGAREACGEWLVMLDDDSHPLDCGHLSALATCAPDVAAIGAEILLPDGRHESGGLPEVIIGCGAAIRRDAFLAVGGYDSAFHYYAEEYDLCAKLILSGYRIAHDRRFRVIHHKVSSGRDMNMILSRLVRNNGWVDIRYSPENRRLAAMQETVGRYERIARREGALRGFRQGLAELSATADAQVRSPMTEEMHDRFAGIAHARRVIASSAQRVGLKEGAGVFLSNEGKNAWAIRQVCEELGFNVCEKESQADATMIATLSPGPILDALQAIKAQSRRPVISADSFVRHEPCEIVVGRPTVISW